MDNVCDFLSLAAIFARKGYFPRPFQGRSRCDLRFKPFRSDNADFCDNLVSVGSSRPQPRLSPLSASKYAAPDGAPEFLGDTG